MTAPRVGACKSGPVRIVLDERSGNDVVVASDADGDGPIEAVRHVATGEHRIRVDCSSGCGVDRLVVKAIPELIHCALPRMIPDGREL